MPRLRVEMGRIGTMSLWNDIADNPDEAAAMRVRSGIDACSARSNRGLRLVGDRCGGGKLGVTQKRVSEIISGRLSQFSLDALVAMGDKVGVRVTISVDRTEDTTTQAELHPGRPGAHE